MINGILYRNRTGVPWRDLPARFGKWKTVYERHRRWSADGTWDKIYAAVLADADAQGRIDWSMVSVDSTTCRAHQHAAGARKKPPRVPGKDARPGSTASTRDSDAPGAASPARFTSPEKADAVPWPC
ncbi:IS5 family transposase [Streptomyces sp. MUSC 14]|nr:IS5 family transposase [Streptomyces sp. MUSC 14]